MRATEKFLLTTTVTFLLAFLVSSVCHVTSCTRTAEQEAEFMCEDHGGLTAAWFEVTCQDGVAAFRLVKRGPHGEPEPVGSEPLELGTLPLVLPRAAAEQAKALYDLGYDPETVQETLRIRERCMGVISE